MFQKLMPLSFGGDLDKRWLYGLKFLHKKYCPNEHPTVYCTLQNACSFWKRMLQVKDIAVPHIKWVVGKGEIGTFRDQWYSINIIHGRSMKLSAFFN